MSEGNHLLKERLDMQNQLALLEMDLNDLCISVGRVVAYLAELQESPPIEELRREVFSRLKLDTQQAPVAYEHIEIFSIAMAEPPADPVAPLEEWGAQAEERFNAVTVDTKDGLRKLAERESQ